MKLFPLASVAFLLCFVTLGVTNTNTISWTASPFDQKVFVENKGQFDGKDGSESSKIFFGTSVDGVDLYFSKTGVTYRHDELVPMTEEEMEQAEKKHQAVHEREEERRMMKTKTRYLSIEWVGANPATEIITQDSVPFYYTYAAEPKTIIAHAYKKIIYKNLYPDIDVEYNFPEGRKGIKYSLIIHPGGNVSLVKMRYVGSEELSLDDSGNVVIKSPFGNFVDHAPVSTIDNSFIPSSFILNDYEVSFIVKNYDKTHLLVIDPWVTNPNFIDFNKAYDVNYDQDGNVYIYGSYGPFKLAKLDNAGAVKWVFNAIGFGVGPTEDCYGDFAVDEVSGTSYLVEGIGGAVGARVFKINTLGIQTGTSPGDPNMNEMWRAEYNRCMDRIVIAGGGTSSTNQAVILDTNLIDITPVNVLSAAQPFHDFALLSIDNTSNYCYMASTRSSTVNNGITLIPDDRNPSFNNVIVKCPLPNLVPLVFLVSDGYKFGEVASVDYIRTDPTSQIKAANGMNGMAVSPSWLYTYDGNRLSQWNKNTGQMKLTRFISNNMLVKNEFIQIRWGGLTVDACDNIYAGVEKFIIKYNSLLHPVDTLILPDMVYDVKLGRNNKLYACGNGFVAQLDIIPDTTSMRLRVTETPAHCDVCDGTATATVGAVSSCGADPAGFSYRWNTAPVQTTQTATGLCPGIYTVTVTTNCFISVTDSVTISSEGKVIAIIAGTTTLCQGDSTALTASGGTHYFWNTGDTTATITVQPVTTTNYIVTASNDSGCNASDTVMITVNPRPVAKAESDATICPGDSIHLHASGGTNYSWQPTTGLSDPNIADPVAGPSSTTTYRVKVTNASGCSDKDSVVITVLPPMTYSLVPNPVDLGITNVDSTRFSKVSFQNNNTMRARVRSAWFQSAGFGNSMDTQFPITVIENNSLEINFRATPHSEGIFTGELCVEVDSACPSKVCIPVKIEAVSTCFKPDVVNVVGKRPGEMLSIPIIVEPSSKFATAKRINVTVKYDSELLRLVGDPMSTIGNIPISSIIKTNREVSFVVTPDSMPAPNTIIATLPMQALLAPYAAGVIEVTVSSITLASGEQITGGNCPSTFSLDSSCVKPSDLKPRSRAEIEGIYPNPTQGKTKVVIKSEGTSDIQLEIYDVFGRKVKTLHDGILSPGTHELQFETEKYSNGIYFCRIIQNGHVTTREFNVKR